MITLAWATKRLLMAEICNEDEGGVTPATISSALESVRSGYDPAPEEEFDMKKVEAQLTELLDEFPNGLASDFLVKADWDMRFEIAQRRERMKRRAAKSLAVPSDELEPSNQGE